PVEGARPAHRRVDGAVLPQPLGQGAAPGRGAAPGPARDLPPPGEDPGAGGRLPGQVRGGAGDRGGGREAHRGRQGAPPAVGRLHPLRARTLSHCRQPSAGPARGESEATMTRVLVGLVLGMTLAGGWRATAADDPPKELTPEERKELEAKGKELTTA